MYETYSDTAFSSMHEQYFYKIQTRDKHPPPHPKKASFVWECRLYLLCSQHGIKINIILLI